MTLRLGVLGPEISFKVDLPLPKAGPPVDNEAVVAHFVEHYFGNTAADQPAGEHTMYVRKAFAKVQTRQKRKYGLYIGALAVCLIAAGAYAFLLHQQVKRQKAMAEDLFYAMKSLDVDIANLERAVASSNNPQGAEVIRKYEQRRKRDGTQL